MKRIIYFIPLVFLGSCARTCTKVSRNFESKERHYKIQMFSGGECVFKDDVRTMVNNSESSDGIYYYNSKGELIEIGGDYVLISK